MASVSVSESHSYDIWPDYGERLGLERGHCRFQKCVAGECVAYEVLFLQCHSGLRLLSVQLFASALTMDRTTLLFSSPSTRGAATGWQNKLGYSLGLLSLVIDLHGPFSYWQSN